MADITNVYHQFVSNRCNLQSVRICITLNFRYRDGERKREKGVGMLHWVDWKLRKIFHGECRPAWIRPLIAKEQSIHSGSLVINSLSNDALCPPIISAPPSRILSPLPRPRYFTFVHRRNEPMLEHQIAFWVIPSDLLVESLVVWLLWMDSGQEL